MGADGSDARLVSTGRGRTTCAFFFPDGARLLYASTHHAGADCPPAPDRSRGYVWPLYDYDLYTCAADGSDLRRLAASPGYDAEGTIAPDGRIVFTSMRDGDLDLYVADADGGQRAAAHGPARLRRRPVLLLGRPGHRLARLAPHRPGRARRVPGAPRAGPRPSDPGGALRDGRRRHRRAPGHVQRGGELGAVPPPRRRADRLLVEPPRSGPVRLRALSRSAATGAGSSGSPTRSRSPRSRCSPRTAAAWSSARAAARPSPASSTSSSPTGWSSGRTSPTHARRISTSYAAS